MANTWVCRNGEFQSHDGTLGEESGPVLGRHRVKVGWHNKDEEVFAKENREMTVYNVPGGTLVEFATNLKSTEGTVKLYENLEPLIDTAFEELGYPGEEFRRVLIGALDHLLAVPNIEGDVALSETVAAYRFSDPDLEVLSAAQKQLLRTGPDNVRKIQGKIAELRRELLSRGTATE